jgi:hypothetical protein
VSRPQVHAITSSEAASHASVDPRVPAVRTIKDRTNGRNDESLRVVLNETSKKAMAPQSKATHVSIWGWREGRSGSNESESGSSCELHREQLFEQVCVSLHRYSCTVIVQVYNVRNLDVKEVEVGVSGYVSRLPSKIG